VILVALGRPATKIPEVHHKPDAETDASPVIFLAGELLLFSCGQKIPDTSKLPGECRDCGDQFPVGDDSIGCHAYSSAGQKQCHHASSPAGNDVFPRSPVRDN
jgi:hypothetical protein